MSMANKIAATIITSLMTSGLVASPAATQQWVRDYVGTNTTVLSGGSTTSFTKVRDGVARTYNVTFKPPTCKAWRIIESNVTGMNIGTVFVDNGNGAFVNATNTACSSIQTSTVTNGWLYSGNVVHYATTNGTDVTWHIKADTTNAVLGVFFTYTANGVPFAGRNKAIKSSVVRTVAYNSANDLHITFGETLVSDFERKRLAVSSIAMMPQVILPEDRCDILRILGELFCGSASASWIPGEWVNVRNPVGGKQTQERHYSWDGSDFNNTISTIAISYDKSVFTMDVDISLPAPSGDYCDSSIDTESYAEDAKLQILNELARLAVENPGTPYEDIFLDFTIGGFPDTINNQIAECANTIMSGAPIACPETREIDVEDDEDELEDDPVVPPSFVCTHSHVNIGSHCGDWRCATCGYQFTNAPKSHYFEQTTNHCAVCQNMFSGHKCGYASESRSDHYFGSEYGGNAEGCFCKFGTCWHPHGNFTRTADPYQYDDNYHWYKAKCDICGYPTNINHEAHIQSFSGYKYVDSLTCIRMVDCVKNCGWSNTVGTATDHLVMRMPPCYINNSIHAVSNWCNNCMTYQLVSSANHDVTSGSTITVLPGTEQYHLVSNYCSACSSYFMRPAPYNREVHEDYRTYVQTRVGFRALGNKFHAVSNRCDKCAVSFESDAYEACNKLGGEWYENPNTNGLDRGICSLCTGTNYYEHTWTPSGTNGHYCSNYVMWNIYPHAYENHICTYCGFNELLPPTPTLRETCEDGCGCWRTTIDGRVENKNCAFPNWKDNKCGCSACQSGNGAFCLCEAINYMLCLKDYPIVEANQFKDGFVASGYRIVNGDDPVYQVNESGFEGAFSNSLMLAGVQFNALTNCGVNAFKYAFYGCTNLNTIAFGNLQSVGANAFGNAFVSSKVEVVNFPMLKTTPTGMPCFLGAFLGTRVKSISAPRLPDIDAAILPTGNDSLFVTNVDLRSVNKMYGSIGSPTFCPSLAYLNISSAENLNNLSGTLLYNGAIQGLEELHLDNSPNYWSGVNNQALLVGSSTALQWYSMVFVTNTLFNTYIDGYGALFGGKFTNNFYDARGSEYTYARYGDGELNEEDYNITTTVRCERTGLSLSEFVVNTQSSVIEECEEIRPKWYELYITHLPYNTAIRVGHKVTTSGTTRTVYDNWTHSVDR